MSDSVEQQTITTADVGVINVETVTEVVPDKSPRVSALKRELEQDIAALQEELAPYREFYEAHVNDPRLLECRAKIKEINAKLFPLLSELAAIARASGAKSIKAESGSYTKESS